MLVEHKGAAPVERVARRLHCLRQRGRLWQIKPVPGTGGDKRRQIEIGKPMVEGVGNDAVE